MKRFDVNKTNLSETRWTDVPETALADGAIRLQIDITSFTSNNISYAVLGKQFGYWQFFPTGEEDWICIPVWGFATVMGSHHPEIEVGERIYGYFPMAGSLDVTPDKVTPKGFVDAAPHRAGLPPIYNGYRRMASEPTHTEEMSPYRALFFPLAATAYGLADRVAQAAQGEDETVICLSASSKTALATGIAMKKARAPQQRVGITSARHAAFVGSTGAFDTVATYADDAPVPADGEATIIDFSGNAEAIGKLHAALGPKHRETLLVGLSHHDGPRHGEGMDREKSAIFFMPQYAADRNKATGGAFASEMTRVSGEIAAEAAHWMILRRADTPTGIESLYADVLAGALPASEGGIIDFQTI